MSPHNDALIIDARLLLDYRKLALDTYESVGVPVKKINDHSCYDRWLPGVVSSSPRITNDLQLARDARLVNQLFKDGAVLERDPLDVAHLFIQSGGVVVVVSHETQEVLAGLVARCGFSSSVIQISYIDPSQRLIFMNAVVEANLASWHVVYDLGLTPDVERGIAGLLGENGRIINTRGQRRSPALDERLLDLINERWS